MGKGVLTTNTIVGFAVITILLITIIVLSIKSKRAPESIWKDSKTSRNIQKFTIATLLCYSLSVFFAWVLFIEIMTIGYDLEKSEGVQTVTMLLFILPFIIGLLLSVYLWIKRLQYAFQDTDYAFTPKFIKTLHVLYYAICVIGSIEIVIYIASKVVINDLLQLLRKLVGAVLILILVIEIFIILYAYLRKLSQLKTSMSMMVQAFDRRVAEMMTKLAALQIKLSILLITMIVGTFVCVLLGIVIEGYGSYPPMAFIAFLGFVCTYCSIPGHRSVYRGICSSCLWCCMRCVRSYDELMILYAMAEGGTEVKSTTDGATVDGAVPISVGATKSKESGSGGSGGPRAEVSADPSTKVEPSQPTQTRTEITADPNK